MGLTWGLGSEPASKLTSLRDQDTRMFGQLVLCKGTLGDVERCSVCTYMYICIWRKGPRKGA